MNALSTLIPFRGAPKGMAAPSPAADRIAAISRRNLNAFDEAFGDTGANPTVKSSADSNLSGLIRRQEPRRFTAVETNIGDPADLRAKLRADQLADHEAAEAFMLNRTWPQPAPTFTPAPAPETHPVANQPGARKPRRQHTVRLESGESEALVRLAKQTGRTYQSILSAAVGDYLAR